MTGPSPGCNRLPWPFVTLTIRATVLQTPDPAQLEILENVLITVEDDGRIASIETATSDASADIELPSTSVLLPGLIDTHVHAPQWPQLGTGLDLPLDQWLFDYTFPLEARFVDEAFATAVWNDMVPSLLSVGTTTAVYYGSIHGPATTALAQACVDHGQRAFVGRVAMDHPDGTPEWYRDASASEAVAASLASAEAIQAITSNAGGRSATRVQPMLTPRFIPACTDALLEGIGELAQQTGLLVQTHCSENDWEHHHVIDRFGCSDTEALSGFGLIRDHTVLAHGVHLGLDDRRHLIEVGAGVAHCPLSNIYFGDAVFPARQSIDMGLRVGLGTDIAGGPDSSVLRNCGQAVSSARMLEDGVDPALEREQRGRSSSRIDIVTAFWMATVGGAELLGIPAGVLAPGRVFDAFTVELDRFRWDELDDWGRTFEKLVRGATSAEIGQVWVDGRLVTSEH